MAIKYDWEDEPDDPEEELSAPKSTENPFKYIYVNTEKNIKSDDVNNVG